MRSLQAFALLSGLLFAVPASTAEIDVYILTGQSNSLGTTNLEVSSDPGTHAADQYTRFFWANAAGGSSSNLAYPTALSSSSNGVITSLQVQGGEGPSATYWGPEFGFARRLYDTGERDFLVIKASKGGGLNTFWDKNTFDSNNDNGHMWGHLRDTVDAALANVVSAGDTFAVKGLMYLQGESNNATGAAQAGTLLGSLVDNLQTHINSQYPNAADDLFTVIGEIAASTSNANRILTTQQQTQLAAGNSAIEFVSTRDLPLKSDGIHFGRDAKLTIGLRFANAFNLHSGNPHSRLLAGYLADAGIPDPIQDPVSQGMQSIASIVPGVTLEAVQDDDVRAWRVLNNSRSAAPGYMQPLSAAHYRRMFEQGWSFKVNAKVISGGGQALWSFSQANDPGWGLTEAASTNGFVFNLVNNDELEVTLWQNQQSVNLGPGSANTYHRFELRGEPGTSLYDFYIDDQLVATGNNLLEGNLSPGFENTLVFNSGSSAGREMYWNEVTVTIIPEPTSFALLFSSHLMVLILRWRSIGSV